MCVAELERSGHEVTEICVEPQRRAERGAEVLVRVERRVERGRGVGEQAEVQAADVDRQELEAVLAESR